MPHRLDSADMESVIRASPRQFTAGGQAAAAATLGNVERAGPFAHILLAGMGGSSMVGALAQEAKLATVPITTHRDYGLPDLPPHTLVIASSFSGTTEETLSAYDAARRTAAPLLGIAAGGELENRCAADGIPFVKIPSDPPTMQPRSSTGYFVGIVVQLLARLNLATPGAADAVAALGPQLSGFMDTARQRGEALVPHLKDATPIIYASDRFANVARIWKIKINENAKTPAFWNVFPELNHNEMIGWSNPHGRFHVLTLQASDDHPRVQRRFEITHQLLREKGISGSIVPIEGGSLVEQIFSTLLVGDWTSYSLALALGIDPSPVPMVEDLKQRLKI